MRPTRSDATGSRARNSAIMMSQWRGDRGCEKADWAVFAENLGKRRLSLELGRVLMGHIFA